RGKTMVAVLVTNVELQALRAYLSELVENVELTFSKQIASGEPFSDRVLATIKEIAEDWVWHELKKLGIQSKVPNDDEKRDRDETGNNTKGHKLAATRGRSKIRNQCVMLVYVIIVIFCLVFPYIISNNASLSFQVLIVFLPSTTIVIVLTLVEPSFRGWMQQDKKNLIASLGMRLDDIGQDDMIKVKARFWFISWVVGMFLTAIPTLYLCSCFINDPIWLSIFLLKSCLFDAVFLARFSLILVMYLRIRIPVLSLEKTKSS
nr:hypothetical protein [Candidatus Sigynarchaeota archaeon]